MFGGNRHHLLECLGCETVFYQNSSWNSEALDYSVGPNGQTMYSYDLDITTYPPLDGKFRPAWLETIEVIDYQLKTILHQMYLAFENESYILAAVGIRTALDRATERLGIDPGIPFEEKLDELKFHGWVGETEYSILEVIINAGNAAAHRGWSPSKSETQKMTNALEAFLHRAFIVGKDALEIKSRIPPRPKRREPKRQKATVKKTMS